MIKYPDGKEFENRKIVTKSKNLKASLTSANRGMSLENDINLSNEYYLAKNIALISKRPTPINVVKVDYTKGARITDAYFEKQSTTDYNGVYKGYYIDFEAKNTNSKTSFPLSNIYPHQIKHLKNVINHGGIAFFIINFACYSQTFLISAEYIINYYENENTKSIPYQEFLNKGYQIKQSINPRLDYIKIVDEIFINKSK